MQAYAILFAVLVVLGTVAIGMLKFVLPLLIEHEVQSSGIIQTIERINPEQMLEPEDFRLLATLTAARDKQTVIDALVYSGWKTGEIRDIIKGDTGAVGSMVSDAQLRIKPRTIRVDGKRDILINPETRKETK